MISNPYEFPESLPVEEGSAAASGEFKIFPDLRDLSRLRDTLRYYEEQARGALDANPLESLLALVAGGTLLYYAAERRGNDKVNNLWDALEYTSTCASVGYSQIYPSTPVGKLVASVLFLLGPPLTERALDPPVSAADADEPSIGTAILAEKLEAILMELKQLNAGRAPLD